MNSYYNMHQEIISVKKKKKPIFKTSTKSQVNIGRA